MGPRLHEGDARRFVVRAAARIHPIFASRLLQMGPRLREGDAKRFVTHAAARIHPNLRFEVASDGPSPPRG